MFSRSWSTIVLIVTMLIAVAAPSFAVDKASQAEAEIQQAASAAEAATKLGPADIPFAGQATFHLPQGLGFIPTAESKALMSALGNHVDDGFIGIIVPTTEENSGWIIVASYNNAGFVKDDDAKDWKADELLKSIRSGTEEQNKTRAERGVYELEILGWIEQPTYDPAVHRLVWSIASRDKGQTDDAKQSVNYNTLALGREGYISMNLVADRNQIETLKPIAQQTLAALEFDQGKRYTDFNASTDKVAAYGLAAIIAGAAAKKLGFLAVIAAFVAKFAKVIWIAVAAGAGGLFSKFKRKKETAQLPPAPPSNTPPAE